MSNFIKIMVTLMLALYCTVTEAKLSVPEFSDLPLLSPEPQHQIACSRISNYFTRAHYKIIDLNDDFADEVIEQFISYLDYNHSILTQDQVDEVYDNRALILQALKYCNLDYPFQLYNEALRQRYIKYRFFMESAEEPIDVTEDDEVTLDRRKIPFPADEEKLKEVWVSELKNEYINQILNDKTDAEARDRLKRRYSAALGKLGQTTSEDAFASFENAFATSIDPHTNYFSPVESDNFNDDMNLSLEGIGAVLTSEDEYTVITQLLPGSPAELSKKIKVKDKIVGVTQEDGTFDDIIGWRLSDVVKKIKGHQGTTVTLDLIRGDGAAAKTFQVSLVREKIRLQEREAKGEIKTAHDGSRIGVIKIKSFYTNLHHDLARELEKLNKDNVKAVIVDLRGNGGGLLPEAVLSSGLFIKEGPVVIVRDAVGNQLPQNDTDESVFYSGPLVVLINRLSASSSEIMAAALRDYGRALIVGDTSYGKGTVQQNRPLARVYDFADNDLGSIHYTIGKFYRINGGSTQLKGVEPDIELPAVVDDGEYGERTEKHALAWDMIEPVKYTAYLNIDAYLPDLRLQHNKRAQDNPEFKILKEEMQRYLDLKERSTLSVNLEERRKIRTEDEAIRLNNINIRLKIMGKPEIANIKDLPDDFEFDDPILDESINIASDFARAQSVNLYSAANTPIFTKFAPPKTPLAAGE